MQNSPVFDAYAQYYDLLYKDKDYRGEVDYLHKLITDHSSNPKSILDLGCGTGRYDVLFSQKGYTVVGVDLSEKMISIAKGKSADTLKFLQGDIRNIQLNRKFDVVVSLFHVMSYQITNKDIEDVFKTAKLHLEEGGVFIFDCWYGPAVLSDRPAIRVKRFEDEAVKLLRIAEPKMHANENYVDVHYEVVVTDKKTGERNSIKELHSLRYLFYPEIESFALKAGFRIIKFEEWVTGKLPDFLSWNVVFVCKQKKHYSRR